MRLMDDDEISVSVLMWKLVRTQIGREELCMMEGAEDTRRSLLRAAVSAMALEQSPALTSAALYVFLSASQHPLLLQKLVEAGGDYP